eukprot:CAMPEP_0194142306 /NCGR_PEP_ID=MMETSP0152-20130528/11601_1 /TAXON_ID=1049557 /ORGANISM="Thalassiothrix antarctica, Strain L6-D1" /LENGTH=1428 /DNA_ID=CAMNT_0038841223 /DNA_START=333 /DNA_END=4619 /DNA_ORIENTATION=+
MNGKKPSNNNHQINTAAAASDSAAVEAITTENGHAAGSKAATAADATTATTKTTTTESALASSLTAATTTITTTTTTTTTAATELTPSSATVTTKEAATAAMTGAATSSPAIPATSAKTKSSSRSSRPRETTLLDMVLISIKSLKNRTGSSVIAIQKYIISTWPSTQESSSFKTRLSATIKRGLKAGQLTKIKASYKISTEYIKKEKAKSREAARKVVERKRTVAAEVAARKKKKDDLKKKKDPKKDKEDKMKKDKLLKKEKELKKSIFKKEKVLEGEELLKKQAEEKARREAELQRQKARREAELLRQEAARKAKERAERLRKRKFPIEDTRLHREDRELCVSNIKVKKRPMLPLFFQIIRADSNKGSSRCDVIDYDCRGTVSDLIQIYHFFQGDVGFGDMLETPLVADFTLQHLAYAVDEVLNGNCKKSRLLPPLLSHLFVVSLQILMMTPHENPQLAKDLSSLMAALTPASWSEVCVMYMECMERYYSKPEGVVEPGYTDVEYLFGRKDTFTDQEVVELPRCGYFGGANANHAVLARAFDKLNRQDPWCLSAEELLCLLRALTDDILATRPDVNLHLLDREEELAALLREKRTADSNFRKFKLAFEGPPAKKTPSKNSKINTINAPNNEAAAAAATAAAATTAATTATTTPAKNTTEDAEKKEEKKEKKKPEKLKVNKWQFEQAKKDQERARNAYEKALVSHVPRSKVTGQDRDYNNFYSFPKDPEVIYAEITRPNTTGLAPGLPAEVQMHRTSWHCIQNISTLESLVESLDKRGIRERNLMEQLLGTEGKKGLFRHVYDDIEEGEAKERRKKKMVDLQKKLEECQLNALREEEGSFRRSGRLVGGSEKIQTQVQKTEEEIADLQAKLIEDQTVAKPNFVELTGIQILQSFDTKCRKAQRLKKKLGSNDDDDDGDHVLPIQCTSLIPSGNVDGTGLVGLLVNKFLEMEQLCEDLVPSSKDRDQWIYHLEQLVANWNDACPTFIGPEIKEATKNENNNNNNNKPKGSVRHRLESEWEDSQQTRRKLTMSTPVSTLSSSTTNQAALNQILEKLKQPLLDLEERIYELSGLSMAHQDQNTADDNMSTVENTVAEERQKMLMAWKRKIHILQKIPSKRGTLIRETLVQAIDAARKANLGDIVVKLRSVLLMYDRTAPGECKRQAVQVLKDHGGYDMDDGDEDDDEEGEGADKDGKEEADEEKEELPIPSNLCFEAMSMLGSLGDNTNVTRLDWIHAVKSCKTISRFSALSAAFLQKASLRLDKLSSEREALEKSLERWKKELERNKRRGSKGGNKKSASKEYPTEMWADVDYTDEFCMVHLETHPWWPAKKCVAKDSKLQKSLHTFDRVLVAMVGEHGGLRCVKSTDISKFTGSAKENNLDKFSKTDRLQLKESLAIARRILRGRQDMFLDDNNIEDDDGFREEKKSAT